jgi:CHAT domain-containing protein
MVVTVLFLATPDLIGQVASSVRSAGKLELHGVIERELAAGQTDEYTVDVTAEQFVRVLARPAGGDPLAILDPLGKTVLETDVFSPEAQSFIADVSGRYRVRVSKGTGSTGIYHLELVDLREATEADRRTEAKRTEDQAGMTEAAQTREARLRAIELHDRAVSIWRGLKVIHEEQHPLQAIGDLYDDLGEKRKALDYYGQALAINRAVGDRPHEAGLLSRIGGVYANLGELQKGLDYLARGLTISRATGDAHGEANSLLSMGLAYSSLGENQKALDYYGQALEITRAVSRPGEAIALEGIGLVYSDLGDKQKALDYFRQSLAVSRAIGDRSGEATTLNNIGTVYRDLGEKQKALDYYGQALPIRRAVDDRSSEAALLNNIGAVYFDLGEREKALDYYDRALPLVRAVGDRSGEAATLNNVSRALEKSQPELAILFAKQAVNVLQTIRRDNQGLDASLRKSYEKSVESRYRYLAGLLVDRQRFGEAEEVLNVFKDKEASDFIRRDAIADQLKAATLLDSERKALDRYEQILSQIVSYGQSKSTLIAKAAKGPLSTAESEQSRQLDGELAAANTVLLRFFSDEEKNFTANSGAAKRVGELRESEGLQDALQTMGPDVVAIYTLVLPNKYTALLVTSGARKAYSTAISEADLNRKIFAFRQQLQNPDTNPLPLAEELYKILFPEGLRQDLDALGAKTIMWSIDSTIRYVPIAALHDGRQYLVSRFRNSLITPASLTRLTESSQAVWKGVGFGVSQAKGNFSALPGVPAELHRIFRQDDKDLSPVQGKVELDPDFTREAFLAAMRQPEKAVVHIATHFDSRPGVAANSNLLLGDGTELSLAEIEAMPRLFSGVDLLTLSACSTAFTNGTEDGREVDSFGTIAQRLGAKAVIASLWSVSDEATAQLMETMYRIRQDKPELGKSEALREAQAQMADGLLKPQAAGQEARGVGVARALGATTAWTHPYYWAPFILIGNWK